ncbi:MAG TPA: hypothetical protein VL325_05900 [Pyrinomonadaceae bacterium]|jgi:hypothetical protein|nr:hypothetical protein [Pyrinomonadaceae bacterium]
MSRKLTSVLGGRFILPEYSGQINGKPFDGLQFTALTLILVSLSLPGSTTLIREPAIVFAEGDPAAQFAVLGSNEAESKHFRGERERSFTAFGISPGGDSARSIETRYSRRN